MIYQRNKEEIEKLRQAGKIVGLTHKYLQQFLKPGISTKEIDELAKKFIESKGCTCSFEGLYGFPGSICISINNEVVHGIPKRTRKLREGDIVKLDIGACYQGYHGDSAWSYIIGKGKPEDVRLLKETEEALMAGVVRELVGHGVGDKVHMEPDVPNYGKERKGPVLHEGNVIAIEPMLNLGERYIYMLEDNWTICTDDDSNSAHFEHTILVTKDGAEILTRRDVELDKEDIVKVD